MNLKALLILVLSLLAMQASARPMITDLSERKIEIDAKFTGKDLLLFGARIEAGNIVVVVRGPTAHYRIRKKEEIAGMWINTSSVKVKNVPQFYRIAASKSLDKLQVEQLIKALKLRYKDTEFGSWASSSSVDIAEFENALIEQLKKDKLVKLNVVELPFLEGTLFRARLDFPDKIPEGVYTAEIYSFNEGVLQAMQSIPIKVEKVGVEAFIHKASVNYPAIYGLCAIFLALVSGWFAGRIFRKV